eukprot:scaffold459_cov115-Cylindrotheca_fusiformis.AAC.2
MMMKTLKSLPYSVPFKRVRKEKLVISAVLVGILSTIVACGIVLKPDNQAALLELNFLRLQFEVREECEIESQKSCSWRLIFGI